MSRTGAGPAWDTDWDRAWDAAEPPPPPAPRPRGWLARLSTQLALLLALALVGSGGLAYYSVGQLLAALGDGGTLPLAALIDGPDVESGLKADTAAALAPAGVGADSMDYLRQMQAGLARGWRDPAALQTLVRRRVFAPTDGAAARGSGEPVGDYVDRLQMVRGAGLEILLKSEAGGGDVLGLCLGFRPAQTLLWQMHRLAWQQPEQGCGGSPVIGR